MFSELVLFFLAFQMPTIFGAYPTYPAAGPLQGKSPAEQARLLKSAGFTLVGGRFRDNEVPNALRAAGIDTMGLVALWQGEQHWKSHPESRPITAGGQTLFKDRWYAGVCPNQDWLRRQKLTEIEAMLRSGRYDIINLDFIRYPVHWEVPDPKIPDTCYCQACLTGFQTDTGIVIPGGLSDVPARAAWINSNHPDVWYRWRAGRITGFCADVKRLRDRTRPTTRIALAAVPWQPSDYGNAIYKVVGQDFRELARVVDVFNPMSYHALNQRPAAWISEVNDYLVRETGRPVWPFVIFDLDQALTSDEWNETFRQALAGGASGFIAFPYRNIWRSSGARVLMEFMKKAGVRP
jgi:hypothetical protein